MDNRRKLVIALGAGAFGAPFGAYSQQPGKVWRIGSLWEPDPSELSYAQRIDTFKAGLRDLGYVEGRNYVIEHRSAHNDLARLPTLVAELLALKVDVIISASTPSALAARNASRAIPVLTVMVVDPVGTGLAASLARPGGNVTGLTQDVGTELYTKRLDLLRQILPDMRRVGMLYNPDNAADVPTLKQFESDCIKLGLTSIRAPVTKREEIATAFDTLKRGKAQGLLVTVVGTNFAWRHDIFGSSRNRVGDFEALFGR